MREGGEATSPSRQDVGELPEEGAVVGGRFRLVRALGAGGMGTVWSARHTVTNRLVALKFVHARRAHEVTVARVVREARAASAVEHANLCSVHDVIELPSGTAVLVMDHLEGQTLRDLLRERGKLDLEEAASFFVQVASALGAAHAAGVLHRDIKPENLFRERDGRARVLDFGIASIDTAADVETDSANAGTPPYMAPEQLLGDKRFDPRVDVWSLGVVIHESLSGTCPTTAGAENAGQVLRNVIERPLPSLRHAAPDVPERVVSLVDRMLTRDADARCAGMGEVLEELRPWSKVGVPERAAPAPPRQVDPTRAPAPAEAPGTATLPSTGARDVPRSAEARTPSTRPSASPPSRRPWVVGGMVVASMGLTWLGLRDTEHRPAPAEVSGANGEERPPTTGPSATSRSTTGAAAGVPASALAIAQLDEAPPAVPSARRSSSPRALASAARPGGRPRPPGPSPAASSAPASTPRARGPLDDPW